MKDKLSNVPSEILTQALYDLAVVERMEGFTINMSSWFTQKAGGICEVCLAGAVMSNTYGVNSPDTAQLDDFEPFNLLHQDSCTLSFMPTVESDFNVTTVKLCFLNDIREGSYYEGFSRLHKADIISLELRDELAELFKWSENALDGIEDEDDFSNYDNKELFINHICAVIGTLQAHGA